MSRIPLYTQTSYDWHCNKNQNPKPYAVDLNVGTNEYIFGRVTPDNNFIVSTGLINNPKPFGIQMVGGKKSKSKSNSKSNSKSKKGGSNLYELNNFKNNELIYNALDKINKLNGLGANTKNSMINAQNNIVGGKKSKSSLKSNSTTKKASMKTTIKLNTKKPVKKSTTKKPSIQSATKKPSIKTTIKLNTKEPVKKTSKELPVKKTKKKPVKKTTTKKPMKK